MWSLDWSNLTIFGYYATKSIVILQAGHYCYDGAAVDRTCSLGWGINKCIKTSVAGTRDFSY